MYPLKKSFYLY